MEQQIVYVTFTRFKGKWTHDRRTVLQNLQSECWTLTAVTLNGPKANRPRNDGTKGTLHQSTWWCTIIRKEAWIKVTFPVITLADAM